MKKLLLFISMIFILNAVDINRLGINCGEGNIKACEQLKENCNHKDGKSCGFLGVAYFFGNKNLVKNYFKSFKLHLKACNLGIAPGCGFVAEMYRDGKGIKQSYSKYLQYSKKGCKLGDYSISCKNLGFAYMKGEGIKKDINKAISYYKMSCNHNKKESCKMLSIIYNIEKKDYFKSYKYAKKGCDLGSGDSCWIVGTLYEFGKGIRQDYNKAKFYYGKGCDLQSQNACEYYAKLNKKGY